MTPHTRPRVVRTSRILAVVLPAFVMLQAGSASGTAAGSHALASETCSAKNQVAAVKDASKGVRVKHGREWKSARKGTPVYRGDSVQTQKGDKAAVTVCGGGTLYMNGRSEMTVASRTDVVARRGEIAEKTASKTSQGIRTQDARAQGRGAYFDVQAQKGKSSYTVARGSVDVQSRRGRVQVASNQETVVKAGKAPAAPKTVDAQTVLRWAAPLVERWTVLTAPDVILAPQRLVVDSQGNIYVTDPGSTDLRVVKLSPAGKSLAVWHLSTTTSFPSGITIDRQNNLYVTDEIGNFIRKMSLDGQVLATYDLQHLFPSTSMSPVGIEVDAAGNMYVADAFRDSIMKLSPSGDLLATWGSTGSAPGQFSYPQDLALDAQGNIYVADRTNFRIQKLSPTGQVLAVWPLGAVSPPSDVTLDPFGNIYIAASNPERIQELAPDGHTLRTWQNQTSKILTDPGEFDRPFGVALDGNGNIYVADHYNSRIQKLTRG